MELPYRKSIRLKEYDYSQNGAYFITICTHNRERIFGDIVGQGLCSCRLSPIGEIINNEILNIEKRYMGIKIDKYVIMPNHIHLIIQIHNESRQEQR